MERKDVFISATTADLGSYREIAKQALLDIGAHPVEQANFPTDYRELVEMLSSRLDPCEAVLHLVGFYYGGESKQESGVSRRSYTQWEYHRATRQEHRKPTYVFIARPDCRFDSRPSQSEEQTRLQLEHRELLKSQAEIYYEFSNPQELRELIHRADELRPFRSGRLIRMPFPPLGKQFIGREDMLRTVMTQLIKRTVTVLNQPSALQADGGVGKTALAIELGWRAFDSRTFNYVFFLNASSPEVLGAEVAALAGPSLLNLLEGAASEQSVRRDAVIRWLRAADKAPHTLVILDNADSPAARTAVRALIPQLGTCAILITSREDAWHDMHSHELELFSAEEARDYLRSRLGEGIKCEEAVLNQIAGAVDRLPLALELVASYIFVYRLTPIEWLREWYATPITTIEHRDPDNVRYPVSLARVWDRNIRRLSELSRNLLYTLIWFAPRPYRFPLGPLKAIEEWPRLRSAFSELAKLSLIHWDPLYDAVSIHRLLQMVCRHHLNSQERQDTLEAALQSVQNLCPHPDYSGGGWKVWEQLVPHFQAVFKHLHGSPLEPAAASYMQACALWLKHQARYSEAEALYRQSLALDEKTLPANDGRIATELNNLARLLIETDRLDEAEELLHRAKTIAESTKENRQSVLSICNLSLSQVFEAKGKLEEAEELLRKMLSPGDSGETDDHLRASALTDLAGIEERTERLAEAEEHYKEAIELFESCLQQSDPHLEVALDGLGQLLIARGKLVEAGETLKRTLAVARTCFGDLHPRVASALNSIGLFYTYSKDWKSAESYFRQALEAIELGEWQGSLAGRILNNLGFVLSFKDDHVNAERILRRSVENAEQFAGPDEFITATRLDSLAFILCRAGKYEDAKPLYERALNIWLQHVKTRPKAVAELNRVTNDYAKCLIRLGVAQDDVTRDLNALAKSAGFRLEALASEEAPKHETQNDSVVGPQQ